MKLLNRRLISRHAWNMIVKEEKKQTNKIKIMITEFFFLQINSKRNKDKYLHVCIHTECVLGSLSDTISLEPRTLFLHSKLINRRMNAGWLLPSVFRWENSSLPSRDAVDPGTA